MKYIILIATLIAATLSIWFLTTGDDAPKTKVIWNTTKEDFNNTSPSEAPSSKLPLVPKSIIPAFNESQKHQFELQKTISEMFIQDDIDLLVMKEFEALLPKFESETPSTSDQIKYKTLKTKIEEINLHTAKTTARLKQLRKDIQLSTATLATQLEVAFQSCNQTIKTSLRKLTIQHLQQFNSTKDTILLKEYDDFFDQELPIAQETLKNEIFDCENIKNYGVWVNSKIL